MRMKTFYFVMILILFLGFSCNEQTPPQQLLPDTAKKEKKQEKIIGKKNLKLKSNIMTPEVLWSFGRLSGEKVSPDGKTVLFGVSYYDIPANKSNRDLYTIGTDGSGFKQITKTSKGEYEANWRPDGKKIGYLSAESGTTQIWEMDISGENAKQISNIDGNIASFLYSPDQKKVLFVMDVKVDKETVDIHPDLPKSDGKIINDLMYRHWDKWEDAYYSHLFIADYNNGKIENPVDLMENEPYDTPLQPFGGIEEINWSADSKKIAYTCKKLKGKAYSFSTNSEIYIYNLETKTTTNLTKGMNGYDRRPVFSPDGKKIAWLSMERAGFEADQNRIFIHDFETNKKTNYFENYDNSASGMVWTPDSKAIYFVSGVNATFQIYKLNIESEEIKAVTKGDHDYHSVALAGDKLVGSKVSMSMPAELFSIDPANGNETQITSINKDLLSQLKMGKVEKRWIKTTDNKKMLTWVIFPPNFDKNKKYPALLYCEGGPQSPLSQFWSYRWNFQMMAANDYIIVAPNRRGVPTFGQKWTDQISKDNGGQEMKDLLAAIDEVKKEPFIDETRLGAVGASYGGFTVFWLAGNHKKRFKAFISHCGVFNSEMEYYTTEEMFFDSWEKGGAPWETNNPVAMKSYGNSPHKFVKNWDTPILVIHGQNDFRIPYTQGMAAFNAAQMLDIPSKFLFFPSETHWVLSPQNGILWQRTFFDWLDTYLK